MGALGSRAINSSNQQENHQGALVENRVNEQDSWSGTRRKRWIWGSQVSESSNEAEESNEGSLYTKSNRSYIAYLQSSELRIPHGPPKEEQKIATQRGAR